jgi:hypothetical protein
VLSGKAALALEAAASGQVNRAIMLADDGQSSESFFVDNQTSGTRFRFQGNQAITESTTAGVLFEVGFISNGSAEVSMEDRDTPAELRERFMEVFIDHDLGKVTLGQGSGAADGGTEMDLSGTSLINYASTTDIGASFVYLDDGTPGPTIGQTANNFDFEGRYDRLRYDTPLFGIATFAASFGTKADEDVAEIAARFTSELGGGGKIAAAVGASSHNLGGAEGDKQTLGGSISWLAASGFNLTGTVSTRENDADLDASFSYFKIGYKFGKHALAVDFALTKDLEEEGDEAKMAGLGYVFTPIEWAEFYGGSKIHSLDRDGTDFDDISFVTGGARLKF